MSRLLVRVILPTASLGRLFMNYNSESSGNVLAVTKPGMEKGSGTFHKTGVPLVKFEEALWKTDAVILAIPAATLKAFVTDNIQHLKDKVLVDATNSTGFVARTSMRCFA